MASSLNLDDLRTEYELNGSSVAVKTKKTGEEEAPFKFIEEEEEPVFEINFNPQAFRKDFPDFVS